MLKINNKEFKVLTSEIKYVNAIHNARKGYSILVSLDIELNNAKGYLSFMSIFLKTKILKR